MHSQVRHAALVPQQDSRPRLAYLVGAELASAVKQPAAERAWSLRPAHGGLESGQLLVKPRNTAHSAGQLWDDQQLLLRMGPADNCTQRYAVNAVQGRDGSWLHADDTAALHGMSMELLAIDGTVLHPAPRSVSMVTLRVTGGSADAGEGCPVSMVFSDKGTQDVFHRATPATGCACRGEDAALARAWSQLCAMSDAGALPELTTGLVLLLVPLSDLPVTPAGVSSALAQPQWRLGATFPVSPRQVQGRSADTGMAPGPAGGVDGCVLQQAVSAPFVVKSHVSSSKPSPSSVVDCLVLPLAASDRSAVEGVQRVALLPGDDTLAVQSPVCAQLHSAELRMAGKAGKALQQGVWTCAPGGAEVQAVLPAREQACRLCGGHVSSTVQATLVRMSLGGRVQTCVATACDSSGEHLLVYSLHRGTPAGGDGGVWVFPPADCAYSWEGTPSPAHGAAVAPAAASAMGASFTACGGGAAGGVRVGVLSPARRSPHSASSRSSGGSSKRGRSPNSDMWASEDSAASHSPKQPRQAPLESQAGGSPMPVLSLQVVAQWGGEPADGLQQAMPPLRVAPMPVSPVTASDMDAMLAQLLPCTPQVNTDLLAGSLLLQPPLLAAEDDLPCSASVPDAPWWEHESLCGSEGPHSHECE